MGYHVILVKPDSPGHKAGFEAFFDFIVAINGVQLDKVKDAELKNVLGKNVDGTIQFVIYSCRTRKIRTVVVTPSDGPILGISLRPCSHRQCQVEPRTLYIDFCDMETVTVEKTLEDIDIECPELSEGNTRTIGLQVDFEDPDIYYFAGGRHVALQTDSTNEDFGPLDSCPEPTPTPPKTIEKSVTAPDMSSRVRQQEVRPERSSKTLPNVSTIKSRPIPGSLSHFVPRLPNSTSTSKRFAQTRCSQTQIQDRLRSAPVVPAKTQTKTSTAIKRDIGEDGWETVRSRNSRSKWSLSSPSSSSSNNDLTMSSTNAVDIGVGVPGDDALEWKKVEETVAAEEERIQEKDVALDNAIREEELIEQELRQVEMDFQQIENEGISSQKSRVCDLESKIPETEVSPSPTPAETGTSTVEAETGTRMEVTGGGSGDEVDDFFFIDLAIGNNSNSKGGEDTQMKDSDRILALREKLMSPAKCRDSAETLRRHQAKLAKAEMNRERLLEAKYNRYVELSERFQTLNETMRKLVEERSELIARAEDRRKRAVEKRQQVLLDIKRKAHDEESKAKEIAFINFLELQIKRIGFLSSAHAKEIEVGGRLQSREEERKLKLEDRFQKLAAVLERQSKIKRDWEQKLALMQDKRGRTSERILRERQKRAKERTELAQEKARGRNERMSALNAAKLAKKEELKKTIAQKQQDTARRHEENIEHIRQRAIELSVPRVSDETTVRICTLCKVVIQSEVQELAHLRGRAHLDAVKKMDKQSGTAASIPVGSGAVATGQSETFGLKFIADVQEEKVEPGVTNDRNRLKLRKKHCKKLLQKLATSGSEFEAAEIRGVVTGKEQMASRSQIQRNIRELDRLVNLFNAQRGTVSLANTLDRLLVDTRKAAVKCRVIQDSLVGMSLFPVLQKIYACKSPDLRSRVLVSACNLLVGAAFRNLYNAVYVIRSSVICSILELAATRWEMFIPDGHRWLAGSPVAHTDQLPVDPVVAALNEALFTVLNVIPDPFDGISSPKQTFLNEANIASVRSRNLSIISYIVGSGIVDRLAIYCSGVRGTVEDQSHVASLLKDSIDLMTMLVYSLQTSWDPKKQETTQLLAALESSDIVGSISMCYTLLLHKDAPTRPRAPSCPLNVPPPPGPVCASLVCSTLSLINAFAKLDITRLQRVLGSEAMSLQFRHIASQLLWQVVPHAETQPNCARLLHELLIALGNFAVGNNTNQMTIQAGQTPTVLQQLCTLPTTYFTDIKLSCFLLPTLIAATFGCPENQDILKQQNVSVEMLNRFLDSDIGKRHPVCKRIRPTHKPSLSNEQPNPKTND